MNSNNNYLILFDGDCPICNLAIRHIIKIDLCQKFQFSPLKSQASKQVLGDKYEALIKEDSLIFIKNYLNNRKKIILRSKAIFRIYWILGGKWRLFGFLSFFPGWIGDLFYRLFAISRYHIKVKIPKKSFPIRILNQIPEDSDENFTIQ